MSETKNRLYIAYGSNLNLAQMARRCPTAELVGAALLKNRRLLFRGGRTGAVANLECFQGGSVPVLIWRLQPYDEAALDRYEGWPHLYYKEKLQITLKDARVSAMIYIMNAGLPCGMPSPYYFNTIREGYETAGFDTDILRTAVRDSIEVMENENI